MPENINTDDLIKVTPLTREQADGLFDSFTKGTKLSQIHTKSLSSIPDVIEGNSISSMQKIEMLMGDTIGIINYQNDELSYGIREHGYLYKSQLVLDKDNQDDVFTQTNNLTNQDVVFKNIQYDANFKLSYDNEIKIEREKPVELFDLMYGHLGSGTTVSNRLQIQNNDYKNIAHISDSGKVDFYDKTLPEDIRKQITEFASAVNQPDRTGRQAAIEEVINAIAVVPLTEQGKSEVKKMLNNREELRVIPYSSLLSIPDTIEGNELTVRLKLELLTGSLKFDNTEATYLIDQNNRLRKILPSGHDSLVNKSDVTFKEVPIRMNEITLTDLINTNQLKESREERFNEQGERMFAPTAPAPDVTMNNLTLQDEAAIKSQAQNALAEGKNFAVIDTSFHRRTSPAERIQYFSNEQQAKDTALLKGNNLVDTKSLTLSPNNRMVGLSPDEASAINDHAILNGTDGFKYAVVDTSKLTDKAAPDRIQYFSSLIQAAKATTGKDAFLTKTDDLLNSIKKNYSIGHSNQITPTDLNNSIQNAEGGYLQKNFDYLKNQIKYLGFTEESIVSLQEKTKSLDDKIQLPISRKFYSGKSEILTDFTLHLAKGKENDMYFLNSYSAKLKDNENAQSQTFYINKGKGFTAKEAFNLLSGRSVNKDLTNKDGLIYNAWVKLKPSEQNAEIKELNGALNKPSNHAPANRNFQIFNENYGYNLKESIGKFPIKEMETEEAQNKLITSLKKGNLQPVTLLGNGGEMKGFIEANPQYKNINTYSEDGAKQFITHENKPHQQSPALNKKPDNIHQIVQEENMSKGIKR